MTRPLGSAPSPSVGCLNGLVQLGARTISLVATPHAERGAATSRTTGSCGRSSLSILARTSGQRRTTTHGRPRANLQNRPLHRLAALRSHQTPARLPRHSCQCWPTMQVPRALARSGGRPDPQLRSPPPHARGHSQAASLTQRRPVHGPTQRDEDQRRLRGLPFTDAAEPTRSDGRSRRSRPRPPGNRSPMRPSQLAATPLGSDTCQDPPHRGLRPPPYGTHAYRGHAPPSP